MPQCPQPLDDWVTKCIFGVIYDMPILMSPGGNGGVNWAPMSYSPRTGYFYATAADRPQSRILRGLGKTVGPPVGAKYGGTLTAVDSRTNKIAWQKKLPYSIGQGSGALATAGDVLFHGEPDGNFQAYDAKNGDLLWQWQTGAGADAPAITYEIDGTQYVAIAAGGVSIQTTSSNGDMIWVFSLKGSPGDRLKPFAAPHPPENVVGFSGPVARTNADQDRGLRLRPAAHHGHGRHQGDLHQYRCAAAQRQLVRRRRLGYRPARQGRDCDRDVQPARHATTSPARRIPR